MLTRTALLFNCLAAVTPAFDWLLRFLHTYSQRAVTNRGLEDLIQQARKENPFPFDHERQADPRANNPPFPFPAARE